MQENYCDVYPCVKKTFECNRKGHKCGYFFQYWLHCDDGTEIAPFGTKSSQIQQNKMIETLCSMYGYSDRRFDFNSILASNSKLKQQETKGKEKETEKEKGNKIEEETQKQKQKKQENKNEILKFESCMYNGQYVSDECVIPLVQQQSNSDDLKDGNDSNVSNNGLMIKTKRNDLIMYSKRYNEMILNYSSVYNENISVNHDKLCKMEGFVTERPILGAFENGLISKIFETPFYNDKHNWKLMIDIKPDFILIENPFQYCNNNSSTGSSKSKFANIFYDTYWKQGQIIDIWEESDTEIRKSRDEMIYLLQEWKGQLRKEWDQSLRKN